MELQFVDSQKGQKQLVHDGHRFIREKITETTVLWKCSEYSGSGCKSRIHTEGSQITRYFEVHNHAPQVEKIERKRVLKTIKDRSKSTQETPQLIIANTAERTTSSVQAALPRIDALKKMIRRTRQVELFPVSNPKSRTELVIPESWKQTAKHELFLQYDSGADENRILIFSTEFNLQILVKAHHIFGDGTFKVCPTLFSQFFTLHASFHGTIVPVVYALLPNKEEATYDRFLDAVKTLAPGLNPKTITTDFESALLNACKRAFPVSRFKGCYFHFGQCIWRKIQQIPSAVAEYKTDPEFSSNLRCLAALAFMPAGDVITAFEELQESEFFTENDMFRPLLDYIEDVWIGRIARRGRRRAPMFDVELWNVFEATKNGESRTNNALEGWHRGFSVLVGADHPAIWKFLEFLKKEQALVEMKCVQLNNGIALPLQKKHYRESSKRIFQIVQDYENRNGMEYLRAIANNIQFNV